MASSVIAAMMAGYKYSALGVDNIPTMTSATTSGCTMTADTDDGSDFAWMAGAKDGSTQYWSTNSGGFPHYIQAAFTTPKIVASYSIQSRSGGANINAPGTFTLKASNTGAFAGEEVTLDSQSGLTFTALEIKTFTISRPEWFLYYRITVASTAGTACAIAEISLLN